ncbi:transmembrane anchor protein [Vibrio cholerae]|uniref:transmembrane anchor protein n=1 Tax=Vibrio cholerae TaxID=666 RepID=UPI001A2BF588|nr:transmembrane anchor protein [Vibrio cholerae]HAS6410057.1 transmembrane anchor protein [Vibrio vulnificus]EGR2468098.1 transmembrane anchor protein [Vibrio cholerae]ELJ8444358.1 transmembrane anchor protein [Vibrio cholerae]ELJ8518752.1 transmembrane anchor protein [Vibrio cholerae]ELJ8583821.1 transmembrane anchor protein [Vibrio cholerae]
MYNTDMPNRAELPTTKQLVRSTFIALGTAIVLLITVILPAEYALDPTGMGRALGLTEMGEIKAQLAQEAEEDQANNAVVAATKTVQNEPVKAEPEVAPQQLQVTSPKPDVAVAVEPVWKDTIMLSLKPGQGAEVKLVMEKGQVAQFEWTTKGGPVNYDTHGDGNGNSISYEKGRGIPDDQGELEAAFTGNHGWFFRNRNDKTVMVILKTNGDYAEMKRVL